MFLLSVLVINTIISIVLYIFTLSGINHFIHNSTSPEEEKNRDEINLKLVSTFLLLILLGGNGIIYYNLYNKSGTINDVVEKK